MSCASRTVITLRECSMPKRSVDGPKKSLLVVFRLPHAEPRALIDFDRRIEHERGRRVAVVERGGIDDRLERGAGLAQRLRGAVELALVVGEAADHGEHAAGPGILDHHGAGDFRHLMQPELALRPWSGST